VAAGPLRPLVPETVGTVAVYFMATIGRGMLRKHWKPLVQRHAVRTRHAVWPLRHTAHSAAHFDRSDVYGSSAVPGRRTAPRHAGFSRTMAVLCTPLHRTAASGSFLRGLGAGGRPH